VSRELGSVRINLDVLEGLLAEQAFAERSSRSVQATLKAFAGAAFCVFGPDLQVMFAEGDALEVLGVNGERGAEQVAAEDLREVHRAALGGARVQVDVRRAARTFQVYAAPVRGDDGDVVGGLSIGFDVTEERYVQLRMRRKARGQAELTALSRRAGEESDVPKLLQQACDAIARTLEVDRVSVQHMDETSGSLVFAAATGWQPETIGRTRLPLTPERRASFLMLSARPEILDDVSTRDPDGAFLAAAGFASMLTALIGDGERAYGTLHAGTHTPRAFNEQEAAFMQAIANILWGAIERSDAEDNQRRAEMRDATTGLANQSVIVERLGHALERARRQHCAAAVVAIGIDEFKVVNDAIGRSGGDELLRALAPRLERVARHCDTVARLSGAEFGLVCEGIISETHALDIAQRVAAAVREPIDLRGRRHVVGASIGVVIDSGTTSADLMLRDANATLHAAKERGGGCIELFSPDIRQRVLARVNTESELRHALETDQMQLHYQPFFSVPDRRLLGIEALLRWRHPHRGLVPPLEFIPLAEHTGLIVQLGAWVLETATRTLAELVTRDPSLNPLTVSVNVSARQLRTNDEQQILLDTVEKVLADTGLPAASLALEITESTLMDADALPVLAELRQLGVQTMLDDFGTGHSSLGRLSEVPLDVLKIDRRFVSGLGEGQNREPIVAAIVAMADALDLRVIAEGVETEQQWRSLIALGCGAAQGFALARPTPAEELTSLIAGRTDARAA